MKKYYNQIGMFLSVVIVALMVGVGGYYLYQVMSVDPSVIDEEPNDNPVVNVDQDEEPDDDIDVGAETPDTPVVAVERFKLPFAVNAEVVKPFFDFNLDLTAQVSAVTLFENVYRPNMGVDFALNNTAFNVTSIASGVVSDVYDDPIFGGTVVITSANGYVTTYSSLKDISVKANNTIQQGDLIGVAAENLYNPELMKHVHVSVARQGVYLDLQKLLNQPIGQ